MQRVAQQPELQTIMTRRQQPAQCEWDGQSYNQGCNGEIAQARTRIPFGHGHCDGQAQQRLRRVSTGLRCGRSLIGPAESAIANGRANAATAVTHNLTIATR